MHHIATFDTYAEAFAFTEWLDSQRMGYSHRIEQADAGHAGLMFYRVTFFN